MEGVEINIPPALAEFFGSIFRAILFFLVVALLFTLFGLTRDQGGLAATVAVILFVLAILALNFYDPRVVNEGWRLYLIFTITYVIAVMPAFVLGTITKLVQSAGIAPLEIAILVLIGVIWIALVVLVVPSNNQKLLFSWLNEVFGWSAPLVFLLNYVVISLLLFASLAMRFEPNAFSTEDEYFAVFLFHLFKAIPGLDNNGVIAWADPLASGDRGMIRALVISFQIAVIVPAIGAFRAHWTEISKDRETDASA